MSQSMVAQYAGSSMQQPTAEKQNSEWWIYRDLGAKAFRHNVIRMANPYNRKSFKGKAWDDGWLYASGNRKFRKNMKEEKSGISWAR